MPKYCASLDFLFGELPLLDRFAAAADEGFTAVEMISPYDVNGHAVAKALERNKLELAVISTPPPNFTGGPRGFAAIPGMQARFQHDFKRTLRYAEALKSQKINILPGHAEGDEAYQTFIENLTWACENTKGMKLTIEPLNAKDLDGYFLTSFRTAKRILTTVDNPILGLQLDVYHALKMGEDIFRICEEFSGQIHHVQVASHPERSEPFDGDFRFSAFFRMLDGTKYDGYVSGEYRPKTSTGEGLGWRI
ncbi:MAG: TIM barrel protein [Pseudomonadota bacterium]